METEIGSRLEQGSTPPKVDLKQFLGRLSSGNETVEMSTMKSTVKTDSTVTSVETSSTTVPTTSVYTYVDDTKENRTLSNYEKSLENIKAKNGGALPSELYTKTNAELSNILYGLTGKLAPARTSKDILVKRIQKLTGTSSNTPTSGTKRAHDTTLSTTTTTTTTTTPARKKTKGCLDNLTQIQIVEMRRIMAITPDRLQGMTHDKELRPLWLSVGMASMYPPMTGKEKVMERMKKFAEANLTYHGLL